MLSQLVTQALLLALLCTARNLPLSYQLGSFQSLDVGNLNTDAEMVGWIQHFILDLLR
jgi:hypothetical protein